MALANTTECPYSVAEWVFPVESVRVRQLMIEAENWSKNQNEFLSRVAAVAFTVIALLASAVNVVLYLVAAPVRLILNAIQLHPVQMFTDLGWDLLNSIRSFVFVALGISLVITGLIMPEATFACFGPLFAGTPLERAERESDYWRIRCKNLSQSSVNSGKTITSQSAYIDALEREIECLRAQSKEPTQQVADESPPPEAGNETVKTAAA